MDPDSRVALAEIRGDIKLILAGQQRTHTDVQEIRNTLTRHDERIGTLETVNSIREGERKGVTLSGKVMWAVFSLVGGGAATAIAMKVFGL
jgi:hypothetical protein